MNKKVTTRIGDVFAVPVGKFKKHFQYVANDPNQLDSDVIRIFSTEYPLDSIPDVGEIVVGDVSCYAHCVTQLGIKMSLWKKVGTASELGNFGQVIFRDTNDYGSKVGEPPAKSSTNWYVWRISDEGTTRVGELKGENRNAYID